MKSTEMLNQIKTLLNIEVKLEEMKLENGTIVSAESFEKGKELFIVTDDEKVAMPVGEYLLEDGRLIVVAEEGLIDDVREVSDEVPEKETEEDKEITSDLKEDDNYEEDKKEEDMAEVGDWEGMEKRIQNLEDAIADLKGDKENKMEDEEVEMEEDEALRQPKSRTVKEEFNEVEEKVKEELSKPSTNPIKHSPEGKESGKVKGFLHSQKRMGTALDRVLSRLNK